MLNNGGLGGAEGGPAPGAPHQLYNNAQIKVEYGGGHNHGGHNNPYLHPGGSPPHGLNGLGGPHHSGGYCSQMTLNQNNHCPQSSKICGGCGGVILERYLLRCLDQFWHHSCLRCSACNETLADVGASCFTRDGMVLCKQDYSRIFGSGGPCSGCGQGIPPNELVMRTGVSGGGTLVYHMSCFLCSSCKNILQPGDRYTVLNGALYCEQDALKLTKNGMRSPSNAHVPSSNAPAPPTKKGKVGRPRRSRD